MRPNGWIETLTLTAHSIRSLPRYETYGCIDSTALNFHSRATIDDGSCVFPTRGCTLPEAGYEGVPSDTPMYQGISVGVPSRDVGIRGPHAQSMHPPRCTRRARGAHGSPCIVYGAGGDGAVPFLWNSHQA